MPVVFPSHFSYLFSLISILLTCIVALTRSQYSCLLFSPVMLCSDFSVLPPTHKIGQTGHELTHFGEFLLVRKHFRCISSCAYLWNEDVHDLFTNPFRKLLLCFNFEQAPPQFATQFVELATPPCARRSAAALVLVGPTSPPRLPLPEFEALA